MKKIFTFLALTTALFVGGSQQAKAYDYFTVAGSTELLGSNWSTDESAGNDMVLKEGTIYTLTRDITGITADTYNFKICADHRWDNSWGLAGGNDNNYVDVADGCTSVTFVFDSSTGKNYAFTDKTVYSIQSDITGWTDHDMVRGADLYTYTYEMSDFEASAKAYGYKVRFNNAWDHAIPQEGNQTFTFNEAFTFDLVFTLNKLTDELTLEAKRVVTLGTSGMGTFSSVDAHNFAGIEGLQAYYVSELSSTNAILSTIDDVPGSNGVLLIGAENGRYAIPFGSASGSIDGNKLWAATSATDVDDVYGGGAYILYEGQFHPATAGTTIPAGKAYIRKGDIPADADAKSLSLVFDDEVSGVEGIETAVTEKNIYFNLAGQRIVKPAKGLYIVNGKKTIVK